MALRRFLVPSKGRVGTLPFSVAIGRKTSHTSRSLGKKNDKNTIDVTTSKCEKQETAKTLLNDVSWSLHPNAKEQRTRWRTRKDIDEYLKGIKDTTNLRKNGHSTLETEGAENNGEKFHASDLLIQYRKQQSKRSTKNNVNMSKVKKYAEILENTKERLGVYNTIDRTKVKVDEGLGYKTAVDWWDEFEAESRRKFDTLEPKNHYQEMLGWSKENRFPSFPIDNEVGMEEEQKVPFYKHVFLHELLEDGFPKQGPVRRFMEAVIVGLSKNPYLSVQEKEDHVKWFREYFNEKMETLRSLGVAGERKMIEEKT